MPVVLQKGQKIDLTKSNKGLNRIIVGLGWDSSKTVKKSLFSKAKTEIDCDASAILLNERNKLSSEEDVIYFGNKVHKSNSISSNGDNLTGAGEGDDEQLIVILDKVPANILKIVFVVNIYDCIKRKQDFGMIHNAYIRILDGVNDQELVRYNLSDDYLGKTTLITGEVYRSDNGWEFVAIGDGTKSSSLSEVLSMY